MGFMHVSRPRDPTIIHLVAPMYCTHTSFTYDLPTQSIRGPAVFAWLALRERAHCNKEPPARVWAERIPARAAQAFELWGRFGPSMIWVLSQAVLCLYGSHAFARELCGPDASPNQ